MFICHLSFWEAADGSRGNKEFRVGTGVSKNRRGLWVEQILVLVAAGQGKNGLTAIWRYFGFEFFDFGY
jgi:hypothetical protein